LPLPETESPRSERTSPASGGRADGASTEGAGGAPRSSRARTIAACVVLVVVAAGAVTAWSLARRRAEPPAVVSIERDGLRYAFHTRSGKAYLWDLAVPEADRENLLPKRPADGARLRHELEKELGVEDLDSLHEPYRERAEQLRSLGYL
jgi:hypothetical protein